MVVRHRLNRSGNRQANNALWRIAVVRITHDEETKIYAARRLAEGKTKREIIRCLKRHIAREMFAHLTKPGVVPGIFRPQGYFALPGAQLACLEHAYNLTNARYPQSLRRFPGCRELSSESRSAFRVPN